MGIYAINETECQMEGVCQRRLSPEGCWDCSDYEPVEITVGCDWANNTNDDGLGCMYCNQCPFNYRYPQYCRITGRQVNWRKLRRKIEDRLREGTIDEWIEIAEKLGVSFPFLED